MAQVKFRHEEHSRKQGSPEREFRRFEPMFSKVPMIEVAKADWVRRNNGDIIVTKSRA